MTGDQPDIDPKAAFYFRHREHIEEWAALRREARRLLDTALLSRAKSLRPPIQTIDVETDQFESDDHARAGYYSELWRPTHFGVTVCLGWMRHQLLDPSGTTWPYLGVRVSPTGMSHDARAELRAQLRMPAQHLGLTKNRTHWPWSRPIEAVQSESDLELYADYCFDELGRAWTALGGAIGTALGQLTEPAAGGQMDESGPPTDRH